MLKVASFAATGFLLLAACASGPPSGAATAGGTGISPDSTGFADYERIFIDMHAQLIEELRRLEEAGEEKTKLAEARSIVMTAEEFYLEGRYVTAVGLLTEAEMLLRRDPGS